MIQKTITLTDELNQQIQRRVKQGNKPEDEVIRELPESGIEARKPRGTVGEGLLRLAKLGITGPKDLSTRHDDYLYGDEE